MQLLVALSLCGVATALQLPNIYWNSSNPMFSEQGVASMSVQLRDRVNIYCPFYDQQVDNPEYLAVYMVSSFGYKKCTIYDAKPVLFCRNPSKPNFVSVMFRRFTPIPNGLEFTPGKTYYFITASSGDSEGIYDREGGLCDKKNVRMRVYVKENAKERPAKNDDVRFSIVRGSKLIKDRIQLDEQRPFGGRLVVEDLRIETREPAPRRSGFSYEAELSNLRKPLSKAYRERLRLRYLVEMATTTQAPAIEYVIGYEANPNFLRSSARIPAFSWLLVVLLWTLL